LKEEIDVALLRWFGSVSSAISAERATEEVRQVVLDAIDAAGFVVVPREPTLEMLTVGHEAARKIYRSSLSGMTIEAQTRSECCRELASYRAMIDQALKD